MEKNTLTRIYICAKKILPFSTDHTQADTQAKKTKTKNLTYIHTYNGIPLSHKKEQNNAFCKNMNATRD